MLAGLILVLHRSIVVSARLVRGMVLLAVMSRGLVREVLGILSRQGLSVGTEDLTVSAAKGCTREVCIARTLAACSFAASPA